MADKGQSIAARTVDALGIQRNQLPERLRNNLNAYNRNSGIAKMLSDNEQGITSPHYQSRPVKGNQSTFLRNLVLLDTLFDDKKNVIKWINGSPMSADTLKSYYEQWQAKSYLYKSLSDNKAQLEAFFSQKDIDWCTEQIPYPFNNGNYSSVDLISQSIAADLNPSLYDQALKHVIARQFGQLGTLLSNNQDYFSLSEHCWLSVLYQSKVDEHQELFDLLP